MSSGIITRVSNRIATLGFSVGLCVKYREHGRLYYIRCREVGSFGVSKDLVTIKESMCDK